MVRYDTHKLKESILIIGSKYSKKMLRFGIILLVIAGILLSFKVHIHMEKQRVLAKLEHEYRQFYGRKIYVETNIRTEIVKELYEEYIETAEGSKITYENGNIGVLPGQLVVVYTDISGVPRLIESMVRHNKNAIATGRFQYSEYNKIENGVYIKDDNTKIKCKEYDKELLKVVEGENGTMMALITMVMFTAISIGGVLLVIVVYTFIQDNTFKVEWNEENTKELYGSRSKKGRKRGIGSTEIQAKSIERTAEEAIAMEGGMFKGIGGSVNEDRQP